MLGDASVGRTGGGGITHLAVFGLIFLGMWFLMIAPNRRRQKLHQRMLSQLRVGDRVLLTCGIFGKITQIRGQNLSVELAKGVRVEVVRGHVQQLVSPGTMPGVEEAEEEASPDVEKDLVAEKPARPRGRRGSRRQEQQ